MKCLFHCILSCLAFNATALCQSSSKNVYNLFIQVSDKVSGSAVASSEIRIYSLDGKDTLLLTCDKSGVANVELDCDKGYRLFVKHDDYATASLEQHTLKLCEAKSLDVELDAIEVITYFPVVYFKKDNMNFDHTLSDSALIEIKEMLLGKYMDKVKVVGYRSSDEPAHLSEARAKSVIKRLISLGAPKDKLILVDEMDKGVYCTGEYFPKGSVLSKQFIEKLPSDKQDLAHSLNRSVTFGW